MEICNDMVVEVEIYRHKRMMVEVEICSNMVENEILEEVEGTYNDMVVVVVENYRYI